MQDSQIVGAPSWVDNDRFDFEATTGKPDKVPQDDVSGLMTNLIEDRKVAGYALEVAKGGAKLKLAAEGETTASSTKVATKGANQLDATATTMALLASYSGNRLGRIAADETGLKGLYVSPSPGAPVGRARRRRW